ncbi:hypothetical protein [Streptomyces buecherae]|uniref:PPM-type phosphatase domain-containing protein n=1 Tax=Streptomyces buecherae TaxID=2763006 RepID=A0A7H8N911_9ACTN|nr:hypothetical protein [Streptomyces buecherae]QKW50949.1 hypothetical protein HUT08_17000 [Streptomyces buecherae]
MTSTTPRIGIATREGTAAKLVAAHITPERTRITWAGDCLPYTWDGQHLTLHLTDHRAATATTTREIDLPAKTQLALLLSDGIHSQAHDDLMALVHEHATDAQALATVLVAATETGDAGYRDDATAIVIATQ